MAGCIVMQSYTPTALGAASVAEISQTRFAGDVQLLGTKLEKCRGMVRGRKLGKMQIHCAYKSNSGSQDDAMGGDPKVQQMLVEMVQIQLGKTRMNDFVDERSDYLRSIAEEAKREYNRITSRTMKGLDATGSKVLRQLDQDAYAIERELKTARAEMEAQEKEFQEYQLRSTYSRNEGLFFKNLYRRSPQIKKGPTVYNPKYKEEVTTILATPNKDFGTGYRQILYGGLSLVIVSFMWSSGSAFLAGTMMRPSKLAAYGVILSILMTQLAYIKVVTGELEQNVNRPDTNLKGMSTDDEAKSNGGVNMSDRQD